MLSNKKTNSFQKRAYFIGIKGVGMTMLAQFLKKRAWLVSGSDVQDSFLTDQVLASAKIKVFSPFSVNNLPSQKTDLIVYSSAYTVDNNSELNFIFNHPEFFKSSKILSYAAALGEIFNQYKGIAVCGTHGKTTTTAYLGYVLQKAGIKPNVLVGSRVPQFKGSSLHGSSPYFIAEIDEYQNKLRYFKAQGVILNNIDYDHPDFFPNLSAYRQVFQDFISRLSNRNFLVYNKSDLNIAKIISQTKAKLISYKIVKENFSNDEADYLAYNLKTKGRYQSFRLNYHGHDWGEFKTFLWGEHNIANALAVIASARQLKVAKEDIRKYLKTFRGTERRNQVLGYYQGAMIIDDYAHHPTEIKATLQALRNHFPNKKIITVFHPHTFSRTKALLIDFAKSFFKVDELIILAIYGSAREQKGGVSGRDLVKSVKEFNKLKGIKQSVHYIPSLEKAMSNLEKRLNENQILILLGAGDVFRLGQALLAKSAKNKNSKN